jgi:phosphatidylserine decarboxylase
MRSGILWSLIVRYGALPALICIGPDLVASIAETFNEFFYRRLKAEARPISSPENPSVLVSCADCRMMAFETVSEATRLWIKGKEFSVGRLLGDNYKTDFHKYEGGALGIFR